MYLKFKASNIFDGKKLLAPNHVLITKQDGTIKAIVAETEAGDDIQEFKGIICPGFINVHCHLELSYLNNLIPKHTGMVDFLLSVIKKPNFYQEQIEQAIEDAEIEMIENGIVAIGDICNTTHTIHQKQKQYLYYHNFIEIAGFVPNTAETKFNNGVDIFNEFEQYFPNQNSIVPHAPYSVSNNLFKLINQHNHNKISSIHMQESVEENKFFKTNSGDFKRLYNEIGVNVSFFNQKYKSSLDYYLQSISQNSKTILVHNVNTHLFDIDAIKQQPTQFFYCLCVLSNEYITNSKPNVQQLLENNATMVVGTDSLASNNTLNILKELQAIKQLEPTISLEYLLQMSTINGAKALGVEDKFGSFTKGTKPKVLLIEDFENDLKPIILK